MAKKECPDYPSGMVEGPDGEPVPRTRAHTIAGYLEPAPRRAGRSKAFIDEEGAWLNSPHFLE